MSDEKFYGWLIGVPYVAVMLLIGYGMYQEPLPPPRARVPAPITTAEVHEGPRCTLAYPRGFKLTKRALKARPCGTLDVDGVVWGTCSRRIPT